MHKNHICWHVFVWSWAFVRIVGWVGLFYVYLNDKIEPVYEISNNVVCATSKASDQPAHTRSLIRAFASGLSILDC